MKSFSIFLFSLSFFLSTYAQTTIDFKLLDEHFDRKEKLRSYSLNGVPFTGTAIHLREDGQGKFQYDIEAGMLVRQRAWYANGQLERDFHFVEGREHGNLLMFFDNGQCYIKEHYVEGKADGLFLRWYSDGSLAHRKKYEMGSLVEEVQYEN